jgi:acetyl-CoA synthetase (ADP-forming)/acetyltransferase
MSIRNLDRLFQPRSVAVIGASDNPQRIGTRCWPICWTANSRKAAAGVAAQSQARRCTACRATAGERAAGGRPGHHLHAAGHGAGPDQRTGAAGTKAAIVMTADPGHSGGRSLRQPMLEAARRTCCASSAPAAWACNRRRWD